MREGLSTRHSFISSPLNVFVGAIIYVVLLLGILHYPWLFADVKYLGYLCSGFCLLYCILPINTKPIGSSPSSISAQMSLLVLVQLVLMLLYIANLVIAIAILPIKTIASTTLFTQGIHSLSALQPWSLISLVILLLAWQRYHQQTAMPKISELLATRFPNLINLRVQYFIEYFISRIYSLSINGLFAVCTVMLSQLACQGLGVHLRRGINIETMLLACLFFLPVCHKYFSRGLRFLAFRQLPIAGYYLLMMAFFIALTVGFNFLTTIAYATIPHSLPPRSTLIPSMLPTSTALDFLLIGLSIGQSFLMASLLMPLAKGLSLRQLLTACFIVPSSVVYCLSRFVSHTWLLHALSTPFAQHVAIAAYVILWLVCLYRLRQMKNSRYLGIGFADSQSEAYFLKPVIFIRSQFMLVACLSALLIVGGTNLFSIISLLIALPATGLLMLSIITFRFT